MKNLNLIKKKFKSDSISLTLFRKIDFKKKYSENI